jgi:hypothetical protein
MVAPGHPRKQHRPLDTTALTARADPPEADAARNVYGQLIRPHTNPHRDDLHGVQHVADHRTPEHVSPEIAAWDRVRDPMPWWWLLPRPLWTATRRLRRSPGD